MFAVLLTLSLSLCVFKEEKGTLENADVKCIKQIHHGTRVVDISWSPETSLHSVPRVIK